MLTSVALMPDYWADVQKLAETGRVSEALAKQGKLNPLMDALFSEQFPEAVRRAFAMLGLPIGRSLAPIGALSDQAETKLQKAVDDLLADGSLRAENGRG